MALVFNVAGVDRRKRIRWETVRIERVLTRATDTCRFVLFRKELTDSKPRAGQVVEVSLDGDDLFGGVLIRVTERPVAFGYFEYECEAVDYSRLLAGRLVAKTYREKTVDFIINDLVDTVFPAGFTTTKVNCPVVLSLVKFNYIPGTEVLEKLAELTGYDWYVDPDKDIYFDTNTPTAAPVTLEDDNGSFEYDSLILRDDNTQVRNTIYIRGGEYLGAAFSSSQELARDQKEILLPYVFDDFACSLTGDKLSIGQDGTDSFANYDALWNKEEKLVRISKSYPEGTMFSFSGKPHYPLRVKYSDQNAIDATLSVEGSGDGIYEYLVVDKNLGSREAARERARSEITTYAQTLTEGEFLTSTAGFAPGQRLGIIVDSRGLDVEYIVNKVTVISQTPNQFKYHVSLITTRTFGFIDLLRRFLRKDTEITDIADEEDIDLVTFHSEEATASDQSTFTFVDPTWVAGSYNPTHLVTDRKRPAFTDSDNLLRI